MTTTNAVVDGENIWVGKFEDVSIDENKTYTVKEILPAGSPYTSSTEDNEDEGFTITNTRTIDVLIIKKWNDEGNNDKRPESITIKLWKDVKPGEEGNKKVYDYVIEPPTITPAALPSNQEWRLTITGLPKYDEAGAPIDYFIDEVSVEGYSPEIFKPFVTNPPDNFTVIIKNTYVGDGEDDNDREEPTTPSTDPGTTQEPDPGSTTTTQPAEAPATEPTIPGIVAGDEDKKTTTTITQPTEVVA